MSRFIEGGPGVAEALATAAAKVGVGPAAIKEVSGGFDVPGIVATRYVAPEKPAPRRTRKKAEAPAEVTETAPDAEPDAPADDTQE